MQLGAVEVLFLHYADGKTKEEALQHNFWLTEYNRRPEDLLDYLVKAGVVYPSYDLSVTLTKFTVPIIKDLLKKSGIKVSGNKNDLIERIKQQQELIDLTGLKLSPVYVVHDSYEVFLHDTVFISYISLHGPVTINEAYSYYLDHEDMTPSEIIIALHEKKIAENLNKTNKYEAVKCHHLLADYYGSELNDLEKSLYHLNQFTMLIVLQSIQRYLQLENRTGKNSFFNIDNYTIEKYRNMLLMKQFTINELYDKLLDHSKELPYTDNHITLAAQFIIRYIIGSEQTEIKLAEGLDETPTKE